MNESTKPMCYGATDLKALFQAMLERDSAANYADLHTNGQRIQALGKAYAKQEKVIARVRARLAAAEGKIEAQAVVQQLRLAEIKQALVKGEQPDPQRMKAISGRLSELEDADEEFPCSTDDLRAVLVELEGELKAITAEHQEAMQRGRDLARTAALDEFAELEVIYQHLVGQLQQCIEFMFVQAAIAGAFFDPDTPERRRQSGGDTRNPTMLKAENYRTRTSALMDGNYAQGLRVDPLAVLAAAEGDIEGIVKRFADFGALSITPIGTPRTTAEAMQKRVAEIEKNRQLMGI